jgi:hypothetical protein
MTMALSGREIVAIAVQTAIGSPQAPTILIPVAPGTFRASETFAQILDTGRRGPDTMDFDAFQGVGVTEITWDGLVQQGDANDKAAIGYLIDNLFGANSTSAQVESTISYDHRLKLGTVKEYLTVEHTVLRAAAGGPLGSSNRQFSGCRVTEMTIQWNGGDGPVTYSVTLRGRSPTAATTAVLTANQLASPSDPWLGWQGQVIFSDNSAMSSAGIPTTPFGRVISGEWTLRRTPELFYSSQNSRDVTDIYLSPLEVTCSLVLDFSALADLTDFRNKDQSEFSVMFETPLSGVTNANRRRFGIGCILMDLGDGPADLDNSAANVTLGIVGRGLYSTAVGPFLTTGNAATSQNGPVEVQIVQEVSAAY